MEYQIEIKKSQSGRDIVDARTLWRELDSKQRFSNWFSLKVANNKFLKKGEDWDFIGATDYKGNPLKISGNKFINTKNQVVSNNSVRRQYALTIDTAKKVAMAEQTSVGNKVREYFIAVEKKLKEKNKEVFLSHPEALRRLADSIEENQKMRKQLKEYEPKVVFAKAVEGSNNSMLIREFAKAISKHGFEIGQNRLFKWFRDNGYLMKNNEPYQQYINMELFEVIITTITTNGKTIVRKTTKITGKGQVYFTKKIIQSKKKLELDNKNKDELELVIED